MTAFKIYWLIGMMITCFSVFSDVFEKDIREAQAKNKYHLSAWNALVTVCVFAFTFLWPLILIEAYKKATKDE